MKKILLTATCGGHLEQLKQLKSLESGNNVVYLIDANPMYKNIPANYRMPQYRVEHLISKYFDLIAVFFYSFYVLVKERPDVVISTGAGTTFPVCWLQKKIFRKKLIFIESFARRTEGSKTGLRVYQFADSFIIQWKELESVYPKAIYGGMIY